MGARVKKDSEAVGLTGGPLKGVDEDCSDIPDIVPTLAVVALFARGRTRIRNVAHLRYKESDRIASVAAELRRLGGKVREMPDGLEIEESRLRPGAVESWSDHRLAMSLALVGLQVPGVIIRDPGVVAKSYPQYFEHLGSLGARIRPLGAEEAAPGAAGPVSPAAPSQGGR
jgi:3-phosphoshikimate 1-carboxyvinyltransferase